MCAWPATPAPSRRFFIVPSAATTGRDETNSGITGLRQAAASTAAMVPALERSMRESPDPFSITSSGALIPLAVNSCLIATKASSGRAGAPPISAASVR